MEAVEIFCGFARSALPSDAREALEGGVMGELRFAARGGWSNLESGPPDPGIESATVVFGQPSPSDLERAERLRWVHLTSAGYARYQDALRSLERREVALTTSSSVYAEPCAEHLLAMMLSMARGLPDSLREQDGARRWPDAERRKRAFLLRGQSLLLLGFGSIAKRLVALLRPFEMDITALRRRARGDEEVPIVGIDGLEQALRRAQHVVSTLPGGDDTRHLLDGERLALLPPGAFVYNVGRGSTLDQQSLRACLESKQLGGAYLDVTDPEPLPPDHPLWTTAGCYITPHSAGGQPAEHLALVRHFLSNLERFASGEPLLDRVV